MRSFVFDVGMHNGEDTDFYLKKGFSVVAFEANPDLVVKCKNRFRTEIENGRLRIIEGAIAPASSSETITFYQNNTKSDWGTIDKKWTERNDVLGHESRAITVGRIDFPEILSEYSGLEYVKIDIEGADIVVLDSIKNCHYKPKFISMESNKDDIDKLINELQSLFDMGYRRFKVVQQQSIPSTRFKGETIHHEPMNYIFETHSSGPFGEDISGSWVSFDEAIKIYKGVFARYKLFGDRSWLAKRPKTVQRLSRGIYRSFSTYKGPLPGWYDTHATF